MAGRDEVEVADAKSRDAPTMIPRIPAAGVDRPARFRISEATEADREAISRTRHDVYAAELGQHALNGEARLGDKLDEFNIYLVAHAGASLAGFVSLTPPGGPSYSIDKYFDRVALPFPFDAGLYESRLLTVSRSYRGGELAALLMYAAFRWVESHGGTRIVAIGRREILNFYERVGLVGCGLWARSGSVHYELMEAPVSALHDRAESHPALLDRIERKADWRLGFPFRRPAPCFHGGASFGAIGEGFEDLDRRRCVINADVLDAWFPPSPKGPRRLARPPALAPGHLAADRIRGADRGHQPGPGASRARPSCPEPGRPT